MKDDISLAYMTISGLARSMRDGRLSPVELTEQCLRRMESLEGALHAFRAVCPERAMAQARAAELTLRAGRDLGPLHGIPFAAKDLFDVRGMSTTAGSSLLADHAAEEDATAVRLLLGAGMVLVGKTHTVQFAYGGVGINHDQGTPHNPWHREPHVPGGSSSGSAVAVAAGMVPAALGSDTGGSVRIPSSLCGITGLKTTVGRVSRAGVYPLSWTLDSVGPLTRSVEDAALVYQWLQGPDPRDETTGAAPHQDALCGMKDGVKGLRLAFAESAFWEEVDPEVAKAVRECGRVFAALGAQVGAIEFPEAEEARAIASQAVIAGAEAYAVNRSWIEDHFERLDPVVAHRVAKGKDIAAHRYVQVIREMGELRSRASRSLRDVDGLLVPTTRIPALPVDEVDSSISVYSHANWGYLRNTTIGNHLNLCGLSLPCGFTRKGLPIGLMIYGKPFNEDLVLRIGYAYQQATDWHTRQPDLAWA
jgi:aspartyl-tRNA(Asn)/glutamyl-tRNA(Gln) amidotransferase subunit A